MSRQISLDKFFPNRNGNSHSVKRKVEDRNDYYKDYNEVKMSRQFSKSWKTDRPWLVDSTEVEGMICTFCQEYCTESNNVTIGCKSYKLDSIIKHEASKMHRKAENEPLYESDESDCENVFDELIEFEFEQSWTVHYQYQCALIK